MDSNAASQEMHREDPAQRPPVSEQLVYASGEIASSLAWNMVGGFLLYYYTDIVFLPVAVLGTLMLVSRILDALVDPVIGILVDRTHTRWGQARPYLLFASIPFGLLCVMTFAVPDISVDAKVRYAYVTFTLLGLAYSMVYIPYGALQPMMARDPRDKVRIGSWRAMGSSIASISVYALVLPIASLTGPQHRPQGFLLAAVVFAGLTVGLYLLIFFRCRERFGTTGSSEGRSVWSDLRQLIRNPVWWLVILYATIMFTRIGTLVSVAAYYCKNVLGAAGAVAVLLPLLSVAILAGGSMAALLMRHFGMRRTNIAFLILAMALHLLMPYVAGNLIELLVVFMAANVVIGVIAATVFISCTDAVEYQERRFGTRIEGLVFASFSFATKFGMALGTALTAYALAWAGYDPNLPVAHATRVIGWLFYYVPIGLMALQLCCMAAYRPATAALASSI